MAHMDSMLFITTINTVLITNGNGKDVQKAVTSQRQGVNIYCEVLIQLTPRLFKVYIGDFRLICL